MKVRLIVTVLLVTGAILTLVLGGVVGIQRLRQFTAAAGGMPGGGVSDSEAPASPDKPYQTVNLSFWPRGLDSSGNFILIQDPAQNRIFVLGWQLLDGKPKQVPVLDPDLSVVVGNGEVLSAPSFTNWLELPGHSDSPPRPEYLQAHKLSIETMDAEPYLKEYKKVKGNLLFLRKSDKADAEIVGNVGNEWYVKKVKAAQDGKGVAICLLEEDGATGNDPFKRKIRLGVYREADKKLSWVDGLRADPDKGHYPSIESVAMPNDASKVAVIGSNGQGGWVACVDVGKKVALWEKRKGDVERDSLAFHDGDFSPNGKVFYAGGTHGELYAYDAETGKYLSMCEVKDRIERVVASPDGKLVAVGLANGEGTVCLIDTATSKVVRKIATGLNVIRGIGFSPDSKLLATAGAGSSQINIYKVGSSEPAKPEDADKKVGKPAAAGDAGTKPAPAKEAPTK